MKRKKPILPKTPILDVPWNQINWPPDWTLHWPNGSLLDPHFKPVVNQRTDFEIRKNSQKIGKITIYPTEQSLDILS